jgi:hypothetical protein
VGGGVDHHDHHPIGLSKRPHYKLGALGRGGPAMNIQAAYMSTERKTDIKIEARGHQQAMSESKPTYLRKKVTENTSRAV